MFSFIRNYLLKKEIDRILNSIQKEVLKPERLWDNSRIYIEFYPSEGKFYYDGSCVNSNVIEKMIERNLISYGSYKRNSCLGGILLVYTIPSVINR